MKRGLSLKGRALQLLAQREQSSVELRHKLTLHLRAAQRAERAGNGNAESADSAAFESAQDDAATAGAEQVDDVLAWLRAHGFASDERFAESRAHARAARFGNLRIHQELSRHGAAPSGETARALEASELQRALHVWALKFDGAPDDAASRARQYRFLAGRGFSADVIRQVLRQPTRGADRAAEVDAD